MSKALSLKGRCINCQKMTDNCRNFPCHHLCCEKCIGRLLFTYHLPEFEHSDTITINCYCNSGELNLTLEDMHVITTNNLKPEPSVLCERHHLPRFEYCIDCKKWLCAKCNDSHLDLFNSHHLVEEEPPNSSTCQFHPNCFLDRYCNDCKCQICHLCLIEGNKHFCHQTEAYDDLKEKIIDNVSRMKNQTPEDFKEFITELDNDYNLKYKAAIKKTTDCYDALIDLIVKNKEAFLMEMEEKYKRKVTVVKIIENLYEQFFTEYAKIESSNDFPLLCQMQNINSDLLDIQLDYSFNEAKFDEIRRSILKFKMTSNYTTKMQFSLKVYKSFGKLMKHTDIINSVIALHDGRLASGSEDKKIIIWDKELMNPEIIIEQPTVIKTLSILNNTNLIAGGFKEIYVFNSKYHCSVTIKEQNNIMALLQLGDGKVISGSYRQIRAYTETYKLIQVISDHNLWVKGLIKIKNNLFASGGDDMKIFIYDYALKCQSTIQAECEVLTLSPKSNGDFYMGDIKGTIFLYDSSKNSLMRVHSSVHTQKINAIIKIQGENYISVSSDESLIIRNANFEPVQIIGEHASPITTVCQLNDGKIVCGTMNHVLHIYE